MFRGELDITRIGLAKATHTDHGHGIPQETANKVLNRDIPQPVRELVEIAREDALSRIDGSQDARARVENALERRLAPAVAEAHSIADQLSSPEYKKFREETEAYLGVFWGRIACPDGRIIVMATGDPKAVHTERTLEGLPGVRKSNGVYIPGNADNVAAVVSYIQDEKEKGIRHPEIIEFIGPHGNSENPLEGCGGGIGYQVRGGHAPENSARLGGIAEYFGRTHDGWFAYDNLARRQGAVGTTFDEWHDAHTQGLVYGLRDANPQFNRNYTLRQNLNDLADKDEILMTERLAASFQERIKAKSRERGISQTESLDIHDYRNFATNAIAIGEIAREITQEEEMAGFSWIPRALREYRTEKALRTLGYNAMRNATYLILADIKAGEHRLVHHPEQLIRLGRIGADFNVRTIAFIQATAGGQLTSLDMQRLDALYNLSYSTLRHQGVNLEEEARIIRVTDAFDPDRFRDDRAVKRERLAVDAQLTENADIVRERYADSIATGETIVLPCIHDPKTRKLTHILKG
jgi:hypothetical protein